MRDEAAYRLARQTYGALYETPELHKLLVDTVRDYAIFALDRSGHILTWNAGAHRLKQYEPHEIIGKHFSIFYPPAARDSGHPEYELRIATAEGRYEEEGWRIRKDGTRFWANVLITALRDESGELVGFAKVTRDLTERREAELRALADARRVADAETANRAKSEFLAAMSHELRTPLNAIGGYADLLLLEVHGPLSAEQRSSVQRINASQKHLLGLINDLLNFTRIEAGQVSYDIRAVKVADIIDTVRPLIDPLAAGKNINIHWAAARSRIWAQADKARAEQILLNLLTNAVKYTANNGQVTVSYSARGQEVVIEVADTGVGIPQAELETIFEPFVQVGRSLTSPHEGTGLGLAISRDLARAMKGDLRVESREGVGSTFFVTLPRA